MLSQEVRDGYLRSARRDAIEKIEALLSPADREHPAYRHVLDYPLRDSKGLRPALVKAACRALGGGDEEAGPTAAVFELLHNAFLVHDDIEDGSELRRHAATLPMLVGLPLAVHAGDTMLSMALGPLLENVRLLDLGRALRILDLVATVLRRTVEGQALELTWIADGIWDVSPAAYMEMVTLKTAWYTFAGPLAAGALVAEAPQPQIDELVQFGLDLGVAFQIRDDVLNLEADPTTMGKESCGDLWEGKRTLVLSSWFLDASEDDASFARALLARPRPDPTGDAREQEVLTRTCQRLAERGMDAQTIEAVRDALVTARAKDYKTLPEIQTLRRWLDPAIAHASSIAQDYATRAAKRWEHLRVEMAPSVHRDVIASILDFVLSRGH